MGLRAGEGFTKPGRKLGIVCFPNLLAGIETREVDRVVAERELDGARAWLDLVHAAALFVALGAIAGENDAVAGGYWVLGGNDHAAIANGLNFAEQHAAFGRAAAGDEHFVVAAAEPTGREATRERELHFGDVLRSEVGRTIRGDCIERAAILPRDVGDVLGCFESTFDFETRHAGIDQIGHERVRGEVLRA